MGEYACYYVHYVCYVVTRKNGTSHNFSHQ